MSRSRDHFAPCPRAQAWDHGEWEAPCTCDEEAARLAALSNQWADELAESMDHFASRWSEQMGKEIERTDLAVGKLVRVELDDCCIHGGFTSEITRLVGEHGYIDIIAFANGVGLTDPGSASVRFYEVDPAGAVTRFCSGEWPCEASTAAASLERERNDLRELLQEVHDRAESAFHATNERAEVMAQALWFIMEDCEKELTER